ncbi:FtsX-like permease family protein [Lachnotalea glycerini]|uniref:ABC3 transporter permease C-terminal domain-containing protein n=1 Tax=Lachnotalea glycerini TaxID=1763509 RepID=A0A371JKH2_9FIRM|nr:FtsX-like permease family protein [Lachnotalea glycerini]RDY33235.1 hypothetical protein CG710_001545 [Lachnotalea glycerini]
MLKLLKIFFRNAKKQYIMIFLTILGFIVSISLLTVIQMVTVGRGSYANNHGKILNHGDLSIDFTFDKVKDINNQQNARIQLLDYLKTLQRIDYTYESIYRNQGNFCYVNSEAYVSESPILRFIDIDDISFFTQEISDTLSTDEVVLARNLTNRMPANIGDNIYISPGSEVFPLQLKIAKIVSDNEVFIQKAVESSYIFLDRLVLFNYLQISDESLQKFGYTKDTYLLLLPTVFYINGDENILTDIQNKAKLICESNGINANYFSFNRPEEAVAQVKNIYGNNMDSILSIFTILSFLLSCCSIMYLVYMILFNDILDINILKIYGLSTLKCAILVFLEVLLIILPAIILGVFSGFFTMQFVVSGTSLYGIMDLGIMELLISIRNIVIIAISSIALITTPIVLWANKLQIVEILRKNNSGILKKKQVFLIAILIAGWVLFVFSFIMDFKITFKLLGIIFTVILITFILSLLIIMCISIFKLKGLCALSLKFVRKSKLKVALLTIPVSLSILCIFVVVTCNYTLLNQADKAIMDTKGYNMQIMTTNDGSDFLEQYLLELGVDSFFSKYDKACTITEINNITNKVETSISYYEKLPATEDMKALSKGIIVDAKLAYNANLKVGDIVKLETIYGTTETVVSSIYYSGIKSDFAIAIYNTTEQIEVTEKGLKNYYLLLNEDEKKQLKEFVDTNSNMIIVSPGKMIFGMAVLFLNNKFLINLLTFYFLFGSVIVVMYCTMIIYKGRLSAFYVYKAYGATRNILNRIVLLECTFMGIIISICGFILAIVITFLISQYSLPIGTNVPLLILIVVLANVIMYLSARVSLHALRLKDISIADMLRKQE